MERPRSTRKAADRAASEPQYARAFKKRTTNDPNAVRGQLGRMSEVRGRKVWTREELIDILHVYYSVIEISHETAAKSERTVPIKANEKTARLLVRGTKTVSNVVKDWMADAASNPVVVRQAATGATKCARRRVSCTPKRCTSRCVTLCDRSASTTRE
eukprot:IDg23583t1